MKKSKNILSITIFLFLIPLCLGWEEFETQVNISAINTSFFVYGEEGAYFSSNLSNNNTEYNTSITITLYRNTSLEYDIKNLSNFYFTMNHTISNLNLTFESGNYYEKYVSCFFNLIGINESYKTCQNDRQRYENQSNDYSTRLNICEGEKRDLENQKDNVDALYSSCSQEIEGKTSGWVWLVVGIGIGGVCVYAYFFSKLKKTGKHPIEEIGDIV